MCGCGDKSAPQASRAAQRPNIVFVLIDTLRADRVGAYGNANQLTPAIDSLAKEGVVFEQCQAQAPWTLSSVASLFCGFYPSVHQATHVFDVDTLLGTDSSEVERLSDEFETLPEILQTAGYSTAAVVANPFIRAELGFAQGFDFFDPTHTRGMVKDRGLSQRAIDWLAQRDSRRPFFLYAHFMEAHGPYDAPPQYADDLLSAVERAPNKRPMSPQEIAAIPEFIRTAPPLGTDPARFGELRPFREYWKAAYDAGVREADAQVAALFDGLRAAGLWDDTYVILTADHGESMLEHGYWGHGLGLFQTELHVPLILRWPGVLPAGKRVSSGVELFGVMPTLMEQLGISGIDRFQARSFASLLTGNNKRAGAFLYSESVKVRHYEQWAVVQGDFKLLHHKAAPRQSDGSQASGEERFALYNFRLDPGEQRDVQSDPANAGVLRDLKAELLRRAGGNQEARTRFRGQRQAVTPETRRQLKALGYVGDEPASQPAPPARP